MKPMTLIPAIFLLLGHTSAHASQSQQVTLHKISPSGVEESIGHVTLEQRDNGLLLTPHLKNLDPGLRGFHVHEKPSCEPGEKDGKKVAGLAAGNHLDPHSTGSHSGPYEKGHLGDLPALYVDPEGNATLPVLAPHLTLDKVRGRSLMIHAGGDTYSEPPTLGGGGARIACGVIGK